MLDSRGAIDAANHQGYYDTVDGSQNPASIYYLIYLTAFATVVFQKAPSI